MNDDETVIAEPAEMSALEAVQAELDAAHARERAAVARLKAALLATEPALEEAFVTGETVEEVEASFAAARALVSRIREKAKAESALRVPAGAPGRLRAKPGTAFEKIREGLGQGA